MKNYQKHWNGGCNQIEDRLDVSMTSSCSIKSMARHHIHTRTGSGFDRTFPDCMMTFVFGWGRTDIQRKYRSMDIEKMDDEQFNAAKLDPEAAVSDYEVTSAERSKHFTNEMLMVGQNDQESHIPLLVYIRSSAATRERNTQRRYDFVQNKKREEKEQKKEARWSSWGQSGQQGWKDYSHGHWQNYDYGSQSDSSYNWRQRNW